MGGKISSSDVLLPFRFLDTERMQLAGDTKLIYGLLGEIAEQQKLTIDTKSREHGPLIGSKLFQTYDG